MPAWENQETKKVVSALSIFLNNKYLDEVRRKDIADVSKSLNLIKHTENSIIALCYNIISILTEEQYGLSGYSRELKNIVLESDLLFSKEESKFFIDVEYLDDIDNTIIENQLEEKKFLSIENIEDLMRNRLIPIYSSIDIDSFINAYNNEKYNLSPGFQRKNVWSKEKKESLIESIYSSIPIPQIYCYELSNLGIEVVDGKQRLLTILDFFNNKIKLSIKFKIKNMRNKTFSELPLYEKEWFKNFSLNFMRIPYKEDSDELKYEIFDKLNSNSVVLNFQELRNSVYRSKLNDEIKKIAEENKTINEFLPHDKMTRMQNVEMIYRFLSLKDKVHIQGETISLKGHIGIRSSIDDYMKKWIYEKDEVIIEKELKQITQSMQLSYELFDINAFKAYDVNSKKWKKSINRPLMDAILINVYLFKEKKSQIKSLVNNKEKLLCSIKNLFVNDDEFFDSFVSATGNSKSIELKLNKIYKLFLENNNG